MFVGPGVEGAYRGLGDGFPTLALMAVRSADLDGQAAVEQHDPLSRPRGQVAVDGRGHAEIVDQLLIDVDHDSIVRIVILFWYSISIQFHVSPRHL